MFKILGINDLTKKINDIDRKIDKHSIDSDKRLDKIEKVLVAQEVNLKEHMRRSDNLEKLINIINENEIKPLRKHVSMVEGALKLLGVLSILASLFGAVARYFNVI